MKPSRFFPWAASALTLVLAPCGAGIAAPLTPTLVPVHAPVPITAQPRASVWTQIIADDFSRPDTQPDTVTGPTVYVSPSTGAPYLDVRGSVWSIHSHRLQTIGLSSDAFLTAYLLRPDAESALNARIVAGVIPGSDGSAPIAVLRYQAGINAAYGAYIYAANTFAIAALSTGGQVILASDHSVPITPDHSYLIDFQAVSPATGRTDLTATLFDSDLPSQPLETLTVTGDTTAGLQQAGQYGVSGNQSPGPLFESLSTYWMAGQPPMPLTVGTLAASVGATGVTLTLSQSASGGSGAGYGYQLYRSTQPHFTPDSTSLIAAPTAFPYIDPHRPAPFTVYYYKLIVHDGTGVTVNAFPTGTTGTSVSSITTPLAAPAASQAADTAPTPKAQTGSVITIVNIGDSITAGATVGTAAAPPVTLASDLAARTGASAFFSNQGASGTTTADWQPGGSLFSGAESAANTLTTAHPGAQLVFSIMLGTNDSATSGTTGAPISNANYGSNLQKIISRLLADYPNCKVFLHHPIWYSPNTHNGADYQEAGLARLVGYFPILDSLVVSYAASHPGHVYAGDKKAYGYFAQHYLTELTLENGAAGYGTFYLHPNVPGSADLGRFQSEAIANGLP